MEAAGKGKASAVLPGYEPYTLQYQLPRPDAPIVKTVVYGYCRVSQPLSEGIRRPLHSEVFITGDVNLFKNPLLRRS